MTADIATRNTHPMVVIAAIAVTLFAMTGMAAIMGWIPGPTGSQAGATRQSAPLALAQAASPAAPPAPTAATVSTPNPTARPVTEKRPVRTEARKDSPAAQAPKPAAPVQAAGTAAPAPVLASAPRFETAYPPPAPSGVVTESDAVRQRAPCFDCGTIESVRQVEKKGEGSGLGAVAGGLLGGLLGHQTGGGRGRDVMTVVGAVGGAVAGHQIEKTTKKSTAYEVTVRFEDGTTRVLQQASEPAWRMGDRVRVVNSEIVPAS